MNGRTGTKVSVRHLPHHDDTIELFDATTGHHLGSAFLVTAASRERRPGAGQDASRGDICPPALLQSPPPSPPSSAPASTDPSRW
ncbi:hypothetical protein [Streptomyces sp. NBC_00316]|uniref:hypothetical protein n=1 Tax=Streptomyces sp. NBC_00316 TaxID=2975710 RepID=UPI002E2ADE2A|nr:hypothetical protein [Streptomyces sp. NBC_00316]